MKKKLNLFKVFKDIREHSRYDAAVSVSLRSTRDGERLSTASLAIGEDGAIIAIQHTENNYTSLYRDTQYCLIVNYLFYKCTENKLHLFYIDAQS